MLARLAGVVEEATSAFEAYDYARALERTEAFFWSFCDDYLELVKARAYGEAAEPAPRRPRPPWPLALSVLLRLLAPFLPFVTEEVWSWWQDGSIHLAAVADSGRSSDRARQHGGHGRRAPVLEVAAEVLGQVRRAKTTAKRSMRWPVAVLTVSDSAGAHRRPVLGRGRSAGCRRGAVSGDQRGRGGVRGGGAGRSSGTAPRDRAPAAGSRPGRR